MASIPEPPLPGRWSSASPAPPTQTGSGLWPGLPGAAKATGVPGPGPRPGTQVLASPHNLNAWLPERVGAGESTGWGAGLGQGVREERGSALGSGGNRTC